MNTFTDILRLADGNVVKACHAIFDGHESISEACDYWEGFADDQVAYTPQGWETNKAVIIEAYPVACIIFAAQAVLSDNSGTLDTNTRSGAWLISQDKLRALRDALGRTP